MRIKKLEICGFKSFAEPARLHFGDGITGVVGPNGCGKSNIVDAIRWCMGEVSAKHLRGRAMHDVIFAGADGRGPQGMAEVMLTFHNDGAVPPAYADYGEICVSRRLFRDGTSEYHINKVAVRLRDVTELFMGTGVGTRAYSIIEQGRIGQVLNARPEERRGLIEEVAGITRFKARKKMAERRMQATLANLARVNDVIRELNRQLTTLRRQAQRAESYRDLRAELRQLELHAQVLAWLALRAQQGAVETGLGATATQLADGQASLAADESSLEAMRLHLVQDEQRLTALAEHSAKLDAQVGGGERDVAHWHEQAEALSAQAVQAEEDMAGATARLARCEEEEVGLSAQADEEARLATYDDAQQGAAMVEVQAAQADLDAVEAALDSERASALHNVRLASAQRAQAQGLARQVTQAQAQLMRLAEAQGRLAPEAAAADTRLGALAEQLRNVEAELQDARGQRAHWHVRLPDLQQALAAAGQAMRHARDALADTRSRLGSLEDIDRRMQGYGAGVRALMGKGDDAPGVPGLLAVVAQVLQADPEWEVAIEAALGERLQCMVAASWATATQAIATLKAQGAGRGGFVVQSPHALAPAAAQSRSGVEGTGIVGTALSAVRVQPGYEAVAAQLLGDLVLVDSLEVALTQAGCGPDVPADVADAPSRRRSFSFVSRAGEFVDARGIVSGGRLEGAGLLASRRQLRDLHAEVACLTEAWQTAQTAHIEAEQAHREADAARQRADGAVHRGELEALRRRKDHEAAGQACRRLTERLAGLVAEHGTLEGTHRRLQAECKEATAAADGAEAGQQGVDAALKRLQMERGERADALAVQQAELTRLKVRVATQAEKAATVRASLVRLRVQREEFKDRMAAAQTQHGMAIQKAEALRERARRRATEVATWTIEAVAARQAVQQGRGRYEAEQARCTAVAQALRGRRQDTDALQEAALSGRMQAQKIALELQALDDHVRERYDTSLAEQVDHFHALPMPGPEAARRREQLERSIVKLGTINLTAIDECAAVEGRATFLVQQRDDLEKALTALRQAIARMNKTSQRRFTEAFEAVNAMFERIYPRLFSGGTARLQLTRQGEHVGGQEHGGNDNEGDDTFDQEVGIDIVAMPPGKKLQNVTLLSGGEKALTAVALIFSIFLIKPSPFCVLDEVDAPLDEANVGRFNALLREISAVSQFIVITHNKQSMLQADRLYGITMEDRGMSKVVSVDLQRGADTEAA